MSVLRTGCFHRTVEELHFVSNTHGHTQTHTSMKSVHNNLYNRWKEVFVKPFLSISLDNTCSKTKQKKQKAGIIWT